jgi:hypothetical protein
MAACYSLGPSPKINENAVTLSEAKHSRRIRQEKDGVILSEAKPKNPTRKDAVILSAATNGSEVEGPKFASFR